MVNTRKLIPIDVLGQMMSKIWSGQFIIPIFKVLGSAYLKLNGCGGEKMKHSNLDKGNGLDNFIKLTLKKNTDKWTGQQADDR